MILHYLDWVFLKNYDQEYKFISHFIDIDFIFLLYTNA